MGQRPFPWEWAYPPGVAWDVALPGRTLGQVVAEAAVAHGDRVAIRYRDTALSFSALYDRARRVAGVLAALPEAQDGIALLCGNTLHHPVAVFGAALAGVRVVMLSPIDAPRVIAHKLRDSGAKVLLTLAHDGLLKLAALLAPARLIVAEDSVWGAGPAEPPVPEGATRFSEWMAAPLPSSLPEVRPDDVMLLQYTGGTTGIPKAAMLSHANLTIAMRMGRVMLTGKGLEDDGPQRVVGVLPLFHIYAFTFLLLGNVDAGNEILLRPRFDADQALHDISVLKANSMPGVPTMWIALANHPEIDKADLSSLKSCVSGGAPLPVEVAARFERLTGRRIGGGWGMTETAPAGTSQPTHPGAPLRAGTIGIPFPGIELRVVAMDDARRELPPGGTGEIAIRGPNVMRGYWQRAEENAKVFVEDWFLTGDIGRMDADGFFYLTDRKKDMILSGGFNVYPRMIEEAVYEHPDVAECIVIGVADAYRGQSAKCFVSLKPGRGELTLAALQDFLRDKVGRHEMPVALEIREELPKTPVGKLTKLPLVEEEQARTAR
jgi:long-chain acyl-CoA synthetase